MAAQLLFGAGDSSTFGTTDGNGSGTANLTKAALSNMAIGDLLVAWIHSQSTTVGATMTAPTGWTRYGAALGNPSAAVTRITGFYYYPIKTQTDIDNLPATITWTFSVTVARVGGVVARATGIDLDNIEDTASTTFSSSTTTSLAISELTTIKATTLVVAGTHHQNAASTFSPSTTSLLTAFLEYKTAPTGSALGNTGVTMGYKYLTTAGATGAINSTITDAPAMFAGEAVAFKAGSWTPPPPPSGYPYVVGAATTYMTTTTVTSFTINTATGYADGDVLILAISSQSSTVTGDFTSAGWTRIGQPLEASAGAHRLIAFYALPVPVAANVTATSYTFTSTDSGSGGRIVAEMSIVRGADLSNLTTAMSPTYGAASGQTVSVPVSTPPVDNNLLLVAYNAQWTPNIDYTVATAPSGMTLRSDLISSTVASQSKTSLIIYKEDIGSTAVASKVIVWNGAFAQASGTAVALRAKPTTPNPGITTQYTSGVGVLSSGKLFYTSATSTLSTPLEVRPVPSGYANVNAMLAAAPFYIAHRGGSSNWPEMSLHAYTQSAFWGVGALELSLARTSDGVWFGLHDATLDRTSGTSGFTVSAHTWAEVQNYLITAAGTTNSASGAKPYMRWEELMAAYYNSHIIFVDPKVANSYRGELLNMMDAQPGTPTMRFVGKYYGVAGAADNSSGWAYDLSSRGYSRWGYFYQADSANFATYQGRWDILGMDVGADQATWDAIKSYGKPVIGHIPTTLAAANSGLAKGANGLMCAGVQEIVPRST